MARLLAVKGRTPGKPLTLAIKSADEALDYVPDMSPLGRSGWRGAAGRAR